MPRFAPNLHHLFLELPPAQRFAAAAEAGFDAVEWHFPYEMDKHALKSALDASGLVFVYAVIPSDWSAGNYGLAAQPGHEEAFRRSADTALDYASHAGFRSLQVAPGDLPTGADRAQYLDVLHQNLDYICTQAASLPLTLCVEGVCDARFPGRQFVLRTMDDAVQVIKTVARPNLKVVFDTYHLRMQEAGSLLELLEASFEHIGHVQIGNAPIRHEPGVGEIDLDSIALRLDAKGYASWIGLEYDPSRSTWESLEWSRRYGYRPQPPAQRHAA